MSAPPADVFDTSHYAAGPWRKLVRCLQLGPKYFLWDLPRYFRHRRALGLGWRDAGVWINPLRELRGRVEARFPLPPHYEEALRRCQEAGVRLTMPPSRLEGLVGAWWLTRDVPGAVVECGSYRGATALVLAVLARLNGLERTTILLDTFAGIPNTSAFDPSRQLGEFRPPADQVAIICRSAEALGVADRVEVFPGLFADTLPQVFAQGWDRFSFVHIDANTYPGTSDACRLTLPAVAPGGVVCFDDYNGVCDLGARLAIDQALGPQGPRPLPLAGASAYLHFPKEVVGGPTREGT